MTPHTVSSSSLLAVHAPDLDERRPEGRDAAGIAGFHEAFAKARAHHEPRGSAGAAAAQARAEHAERAEKRDAGRLEGRADASTRRRADAGERHEADASRTAARDDADRRAVRRADDASRRAAKTDDRTTSPTADAAATDSPRVDDGAIDTGADDGATTETTGPTGPAHADASALFAFLQPAATQPLAAPQGPLRLALSEGSADEAAAHGDGAGGSAKLAGALGTTFADTDHTSEATLHHLTDAFARAEHLAARGALGQESAHADAAAAALSTEGMQLSSDARALLEAQAPTHAARGAQSAPLPKALDGSSASDEATKTQDTAAGGTVEAVAAAGSPAGGAGTREARRDGGGFGEGGGAEADERSDRGLEFARDSFAKAPSSAAAEVRDHGAFGIDPRMQSAMKSEATPEARAEQAKAASERILQQIERITEQRNVGRDMIIATERGPVRVRVDIAEKQVSVAFRTEDDQLKAMLRSGLPALQSTLAKRGYADSEFRFDGDGSNDMMASGGRGKHAEARAMRESLLGEVMVEPVIADAADSARRDPKALLSVTA